MSITGPIEILGSDEVSFPARTKAGNAISDGGEVDTGMFLTTAGVRN